MNILIAEDEKPLQKILTLYLSRAGFTVLTANDGEEALEILSKKTVDMVVADWMMPRVNGIELCAFIRQNYPDCKVLILTAKTTSADELQGLTAGAHDYVKKPFDMDVLLARIKRLLPEEAHNLITAGALTLDMNTKTFYVSQQEVKLTPTEFRLIHLLLTHPGQTVSRETFFSRIWGTEYNGDERTLDTHIGRLRKKIGTHKIIAYAGIGYRLETE